MIGEDPLDVMLRQHFGGGAAETDDASAARVLATLAQPLPAQRQSWRLWPRELLDWRFAPAWPRLAALACCAALGFAVGVASPIVRHRHVPIIVAQQTEGGGLAAVLSEPEPLTGVLP
jgi:hypothetical protein